MRTRSWIRRILGVFGLEPGDVAAAVAGAYFGSRGSHAAASGTEGGTPPPIAPKQEDEGSFNYLCNVLSHGGNVGQRGAECLRRIHNALFEIHPDYAEQFRNFFFTVRNISSGKMIEDLQKLLARLQDTPLENRWTKVLQNNCFPIVTAKGILDEVAKEHQKLDSGSEDEKLQKACSVVANKMISDGRLPGTSVIHAEEKAKKIVQGFVEASGKTLPEVEESTRSVAKISVLTIAGMIVLLIVIAMVSTCSNEQPIRNYQTGEASKKLASKLDAALQPEE